MNQHVNDPKLIQILEQIQKFGFIFQGYDESGMPLVVAPNGQIVDVNVAIRFVNEQVQRARNSSSGSPESPNFSESIDTKSPETTVERKAESESGIEQKKEEPTQKQDSNDLVVKPVSPQISLSQPKKNKIMGDGFEPQSFDPSNIASTIAFVNDNLKISNKNSSKWLAAQFRKFLEENDIKIKG